VEDAARIVEGRRDQTLAAQDMCRTEPLVEDVKVLHAIQQGQDRRLRSNRCSKRIDGGIEVVGFAAQQNQVEVPVYFMSLNGRRRFEYHIAKAAFDHETSFSELDSPFWSDEKGDIATGLEQSAAKVSTDRTRADDENSHSCYPFSLVAHFNANMFVIKATRAHLWIALDQTTRLT
jgi:hypothetical protein